MILTPWTLAVMLGVFGAIALLIPRRVSKVVGVCLLFFAWASVVNAAVAAGASLSQTQSVVVTVVAVAPIIVIGLLWLIALKRGADQMTSSTQ